MDIFGGAIILPTKPLQFDTGPPSTSCDIQGAPSLFSVGSDSEATRILPGITSGPRKARDMASRQLTLMLTGPLSSVTLQPGPVVLPHPCHSMLTQLREGHVAGTCEETRETALPRARPGQEGTLQRGEQMDNRQGM